MNFAALNSFFGKTENSSSMPIERKTMNTYNPRYKSNFVSACRQNYHHNWALFRNVLLSCS